MHECQGSVSPQRSQRGNAPLLEWILLITVVVIGIIGSVRTHFTLKTELVDLAEHCCGLNVKPEAEAESEP